MLTSLKKIASPLCQFQKRQYKSIDYGLYLVTDNELINRTSGSIESTIESAIKGGVSIVQFREKKVSSTRDLINGALKIKIITDKYKVSLIVNDRIDIALAINSDGLHIGQSDIHPKSARKLLGYDKILGVTVGNLKNVKEALSYDVKADYLGTNAIYYTSTKPDSDVLGINKLKEIVQYARTLRSDIPITAIGSLNTLNCDHILKEVNEIDSIAVVSSICASTDPQTDAMKLRKIINLHSKRRMYKNKDEIYLNNFVNIHENISLNLQYVRDVNPLVHCITNMVVTTQTANFLLAIGANPLMSHHPKEMEDISNISDALLINIGTLDDYSAESMKIAANLYSKLGKPIVLDPVGFGASKARNELVLNLLLKYKISVLKGNFNEIYGIYSSIFSEPHNIKSKGVNSGEYEYNKSLEISTALAIKLGCVVCITGPNDVVTNGKETIIVRHDVNKLMHITGMGCVIGGLQAACISAAKKSGLDTMNSNLIGAVCGISILSISGEISSLKSEKSTSLGSFFVNLVDQVSSLRTTSFRKILNIEYLDC